MKHLLNIAIVLIFAQGFLKAQTTKCLLIESLTNLNGLPTYKLTQNFDKHDNLLSKETIQYMGQTVISSKNLFEYDAQNREIKRQDFFNNVLTKITNKQYNANGKLVSSNESKDSKALNNATYSENNSEQLYYNENGAVVSKEAFEKVQNTEKRTKFDAQNNITSKETKVFSSSGKLIENEHDDVLGGVNQKIKYQFDAKDLLLREEEFVNGALKGYFVYQYQGKNLVKKTRFTKTDQEDYRIEYDYDLKGNQIEMVAYYRNILASKQTKVYDEKNNLILETNFDKDGQKINETTYKYNCK